jgi:hypothetical protein
MKTKLLLRASATMMVALLQARILVEVLRDQTTTEEPPPVFMDMSSGKNSKRTEESRRPMENLPTALEANCISFPKSARTFFPKRFFEEGNGRRFLPFYDYVTVFRREFLIFRDIHKRSTCKAVYYHNHKVGGTTMGLAGRRNREKFRFKSYYAGRQDRMGLAVFYNFSQELMQSIYTYQQQQQNQKDTHDLQTILFSFTRDPVKRFVSSVGEVLKIASKDLAPCHRQNNTTGTMLECVLDKIEHDSSYLNEHLVPQSYEFYKGVMGYDIGINIMDISNMPAVLRELGVSEVPKARSAKGVIKGFNLTVNELSPAMIDKICHLYRMDVEMLHMAGASQTGCDRSQQK